MIVWLILALLTGVTQMIPVNKTFVNLSPEQGSTQGPSLTELSTDLQTKSRNITLPEVITRDNEAVTKHHPFMQVIYDEISSKEHQKWNRIWKNEISIKGIEPVKVERKENGTAVLVFKNRKNDEFLKIQHAMLVLPVTRTHKLTYPKDFKVILHIANPVSCATTLTTHPKNSYTLLDLTPCFHQRPHMKTFWPGTFNITLFWEDGSVADIGRPLLVLYFFGRDLQKVKSTPIIPLSKQLHRLVRRSAYPTLSMREIQKWQQSPRQFAEPCTLHKWQVTLEDLQWESWVIAPAEFTLNYCSGLCEAPFLGLSGNTSSNAVIRSILLSKRPLVVPVDMPEGHCVPIQMGHTDFMYRDEDDIVIEKLENIVASQCGCL